MLNSARESGLDCHFKLCYMYSLVTDIVNIMHSYTYIRIQPGTCDHG